MFFDVTIQEISSACFSERPLGVATVMSAVVIGQHESIFMLEKFIKIKVLNRFVLFLCCLAANVYSYICLTESLTYCCLVIFCQQDDIVVF